MWWLHRILEIGQQFYVVGGYDHVFHYDSDSDERIFDAQEIQTIVECWIIESECDEIIVKVWTPNIAGLLQAV